MSASWLIELFRQKQAKIKHHYLHVLVVADDVLICIQMTKFHKILVLTLVSLVFWSILSAAEEVRRCLLVSRLVIIDIVTHADADSMDVGL